MESLAVAFITGAAGFGGALAGGYITYKSNEKVQDRQVGQEAARRADSARAVARLLMSEYHKDADRLEELAAEGMYIPALYRQRTFVSRIGLEDRKLLAGQLSEQVWIDVAGAASAIEEVEADFEAHDGKGLIGAEELETLKAARAACDKAYKALTPLAEHKSVS
jgi:hypothetical protein